MAAPPSKKENAKPSFHFDFNSPDLRARSNKESIYSDSSDDETPKRAKTIFPSNPTTFAAFLKPNEGKLFGQIAGGSAAPAVKKEEAANGGTFSRAVSLSNTGFEVVPKQTQGESNLITASPGVFTSFGAPSATTSLFKTASPQTAPISDFSSAMPPGPQSLSPFGAAAQPPSTQGSSPFSSSLFPAAAMPSWLFPAATTTSTPVASVSTFQNGARQVSQSLGPAGPVAQSSSAPVPAASGTPSFFTATTTTAQVTSVSVPKNNSTPVSQPPNLFGDVTQSADTPKLAPTIPESTIAQLEEARLFAVHIKLLDMGTSFQDQHEITGTPLFTKKVLDYSENLFSQYGFLAGVSDVLESNEAAKLSIDGLSQPADPRLFFNISAPSSAFICGSQGSGKSHTLSCLLENCLMKSDVSKLDSPLAGLVFHYDSFTSDVNGTPCEAAHISSNPNVKVRILVSPTNLETMKRTYAGLKVTVEPLQINQTDLNTKRMLELMCVNENEGRMPLYLHTVTRILREMRLLQQTKNTGFNYAEFKRLVSLCDMTREQLMPLHQRLDSLESFMPHSQRSANPQRKNSKGSHASGSDWSVQAGTLTIVDLSCPCVTAEAACSLFNMCLSLFLEQHTKVGRVIGLDEAHKYMSASAEAGTLTNTLLSSIRLQRHLGTRVFISTQEPTISPKLLDLCSITIVHRFTSPDWLRELRSHLAALDNDEEDPGKSKIKLINIFNKIVKLRTGEALLFAPSAIIGVEKQKPENGSEETVMKRLGIGYLKIKIRARVTSDGGRSVFALGGSQAGSGGAGGLSDGNLPSSTNFPATVNNSGFGDPFDPFKSKKRTRIIGDFTTNSPSGFGTLSFNLPALGTRCLQFQPFIEKEQQSPFSNQLNSFQNICFQLPYQKHSMEELRLADYAVGVRYRENNMFGGFAKQ